MYKTITVALGAALLMSCGGGGGNKGTCIGSDAECKRDAVKLKDREPVVCRWRELQKPVTELTCQDIRNTSTPGNYKACALNALNAGATQLDADKDGDPCE